MKPYPPELLAADERRGHPFLPSTFDGIPKLYATERVPLHRKEIVLHYFLGSADWWIAEVNPDDLLAFGYACLGDPAGAEWGYVDLNELGTIEVEAQMRMMDMTDEGLPGPTGIVRYPMLVERDLYWNPKPFGEVAR